MGRKFLTIEEVAQILNVNEALIYSLVKKNKIPSYHLGTNIRVNEDELKILTGQKKLKPLYPIKQASGVLKLSPATLYSLIKKRKIKAPKFGRVRRLASIYGYDLNQQFLKIEELSKILSVNPCTVRRLIIKGQVKSIKIGNQYRIPESIAVILTNQVILKPLLSINQAARILGKSRLTIINYIHHQKLKAIKIGRLFRLSEESIKEYQEKLIKTYSINEFAQIFRVSSSLVRKLIKKKEIKAEKMGREYRINPNVIESLSESSKSLRLIKKI